MGDSKADVDVAIIGSGFAGLGMAIRLKKAGRDDFVIWEKESEVGGTWHVNHYPGCACDVQSHLYSFSFEPNPGWSRTYSPQREIWRYLDHCVEKYQLRQHIRFGTEMQQAHFDDASGLWALHDADGRVTTARVLISAMGGLSRPRIPDFPGLDSFQGMSFHSQQWNHAYDLRGKRVAVIGTGASAIQFVPKIAQQLERLDLYQRTPPWIMPKPDYPVSERIQNWFRKMPALQAAYRNALYWYLEVRAAGFTGGPAIMKLIQPQAMRHLKKQVPDPALRAKLTPDYILGCKRVLLSNDYYPALTRDNVHLHTGGVKAFTPTGVVDQDGRVREVDAVILGTGFAATEPLPAGVLTGRHGLDLTEAWASRGPEAYKGCTVPGFPNLFMLAGPNTGLGHTSMVFMLESQMQYVMNALERMDAAGVHAVEIKAEACRRFNERLQSRMARTVWSRGGCNSWYVDDQGRNVTLWPYFTWQFRLATRRFDMQNYVPVEARQTRNATGGLTEQAA